MPACLQLNTTLTPTLEGAGPGLLKANEWTSVKLCPDMSDFCSTYCARRHLGTKRFVVRENIQLSMFQHVLVSDVHAWLGSFPDILDGTKLYSFLTAGNWGSNRESTSTIILKTSTLSTSTGFSGFSMVSLLNSLIFLLGSMMTSTRCFGHSSASWFASRGDQSTTARIPIILVCAANTMMTAYAGNLVVIYLFRAVCPRGFHVDLRTPLRSGGQCF